MGSTCKINVMNFEYFLNLDEFCHLYLQHHNFFSSGQKWKDMRATMSPAFTSSKMRVMIPFMAEAGDNMINRIKKSIANSDSKLIYNS